MEPRVLRIERVFPNSVLQGRDYTWFQMVFDSLVEEMKLRICGCFMDKQARFVLNREMYRLFCSVAPIWKGPYWYDIYIKEDLTPEYLPWNKNVEQRGRILLEYREPVYIPFEFTERRNTMPPEKIKPYEFYFVIPKDLEIKKVIYNNLGNTSKKLNDVLHKWEKKEEPQESER